MSDVAVMLLQKKKTSESDQKVMGKEGKGWWCELSDPSQTPPPLSPLPGPPPPAH